MTNQTIRLSSRQKYAVTCPTCGAGVNQSCVKAPRFKTGTVGHMSPRLGASSRMHTERVRAATAAVRAEVAEAVKVTWMFNWVVGGYNTVRAASMAEALVLAKALGQGWNSGGVVEGSLRVVTQDEVNKVDAAWAPFFD